VSEIWLNWWKEIFAASAIGVAIVAKTLWTSLVPILQAWSQNRAESYRHESKVKEQEQIIKALVEGIEEYTKTGGDLKALIQSKSFAFGVADELHAIVQESLQSSTRK
jgi:hypothetical protein